MLELVTLLLKHGADSNFEGFPATPLLTVLSQDPFCPEDREFMQTLLQKLIDYGADVDTVAKKGPYRSDKSARQKMEKLSFTFTLPTSPSTSPIEG